MMNENMTFTVLDENGRETKCEALFTFDSEETGKSYIGYTDNSVDEDANTQVFVSIYNPDSDEQRLMPIETEKKVEDHRDYSGGTPGRNQWWSR